MFEIQKIEVTCTSASTNSENQGSGGDTKLGMSMYVEFLGNNEMLDKFDPKLRPSLYESAGNGQQQDLTGHLPTLKFKLDKPICWPYVGLGYGALLHTEFDVNEPFIIEDCKVDKFQFSLKDDAVVGFKFRIYFHPGLEDVGPLCALEKHKVTLTLTPPDVVDQPEPEEQSEESPQGDLLADADDESSEVDVMYPRAVASVRATGNPTASSLQNELRIGFVHAAKLLARMEEEGVIHKDEEAGEYVVVAAEAAA